MSTKSLCHIVCLNFKLQLKFMRCCAEVCWTGDQAWIAMSSMLRSDCCSRFQSYQQLSIEMSWTLSINHRPIIRRHNNNSQPDIQHSSRGRQHKPNSTLFFKEVLLSHKKELEENSLELYFLHSLMVIE